MNALKSQANIRFQESVNYQIEVAGRLDTGWSDYLCGMQITSFKSVQGEPTTVLVGRLADQSALLGVLNTLYNYHVPLISVSILSPETAT